MKARHSAQSPNCSAIAGCAWSCATPVFGPRTSPRKRGCSGSAPQAALPPEAEVEGQEKGKALQRPSHAERKGVDFPKGNGSSGWIRISNPPVNSVTQVVGYAGSRAGSSDGSLLLAGVRRKIGQRLARRLNCVLEPAHQAGHRLDRGPHGEREPDLGLYAHPRWAEASGTRHRSQHDQGEPHRSRHRARTGAPDEDILEDAPSRILELDAAHLGKPRSRAKNAHESWNSLRTGSTCRTTGETDRRSATSRW